MPMQVFDNDPQPGYIRWAGVHIVYKGQDYAVQDGYTNKKYVWWDYDYPNVFQTSDTYPTDLTDDDVIVFLNKNGIHLTVPTTTVVDGSLIVPESILANAIAANTITGDKLVAGAISAREIAADAVGAAAIAAGAVLAEHIAADAVTSTHILAGSILAEHIAANAIQTNHIATGAVTAQKIAAGSITTSHISTSGLDASVIKTGTMLFNRVRGGTAELGGSGNGNGLLIVRDANNTERVRVDNRGIVVNEASIRIKDNFTGVESHIRPSANMLLDHSFELVQWTGYENPAFTFPVADPGVWFVSSIGNARIATGDPFDTWPRIGLHGVQAAVVRHTGTVYWYQNTSLDKTVGRAGPYTASAYFAAYEATTQNTTAKIELWALDRYGNRISGTQVVGYVSINANEKYVWKRAKVTISNLPSNTEYLQVVLGLSGEDTYVLCDAVQLVPLDNPAIYEPEGNLWSFIRGNIVAPHLLAKNQQVENLSVTKGFQFPNISNPGGNAKPSAYPMGLSWHLISADSSWPSSYGTALTFRLSGSRGFQFFFSNASPPASYVRSITPINGDYNNWGSWKEI